MSDVEAVANAVTTSIEATREFGHFISRYIHGPVEQGMGIFEDKLKYYRWENQIKYMMRAEKFLKLSGLNEPNQAIKLKLAVPLLEAASMEDDDYLQDLWAKLLVNSANKDSGINLNRHYIDILERLSPIEAKILEKIYSVKFEDAEVKAVVTQYLPDKIELFDDNWQKQRSVILSDEIMLALINLARLGCIKPTSTIGGGEIFSVVNMNLLGKHFVEACTLKNEVYVSNL